MNEYVELPNHEVARVQHFADGSYGAVNEFGTVLENIQQGSGGWEIAGSGSTSSYGGFDPSANPYGTPSYFTTGGYSSKVNIAGGIAAIRLILLYLFCIVGAVSFTLQALFGLFTLVLRIFMHPRVAAWHCEYIRKSATKGGMLTLLSVAITVPLLYYTDEETAAQYANIADMYAESWRFLVIAIGIYLIPVVANVLRLGHVIIAQLYPTKVRGNGYGLLNLVAILPKVRPTRLLTMLPEMGLPLLYVAGMVFLFTDASVPFAMIQNGQVSPSSDSWVVLAIYGVPLVMYLIFMNGMLWRYDRRFAH